MKSEMKSSQQPGVFEYHKVLSHSWTIEEFWKGIQTGARAVADAACWVANGVVDGVRWIGNGVRNIFNKLKKQDVNEVINFAGGGYLPHSVRNAFNYGAANIEFIYEISQLSITEEQYASNPFGYARYVYENTDIAERYASNSHTKSTQMLSDQDWVMIEEDASRLFTVAGEFFNSYPNAKPIHFMYYNLNSNRHQMSENIYEGNLRVIQAYEEYLSYFEYFVSLDYYSPGTIVLFTWDFINTSSNSFPGFNEPFASLNEINSLYGGPGLHLESITRGEYLTQMISSTLHRYLLYWKTHSNMPLYY